MEEKIKHLANLHGLDLDDREKAMLDALQKELHVDDPQELLNMLVRQAYYRTSVSCPRCGHLAQQTDDTEALCRDCLSPLRLIEGMWQTVGYDNL